MKTRISNPFCSGISAVLSVLTLGCIIASSTEAASIYWDGTSASWNLNANWSTDTGATTPDPSAVPGAADDAIFNISTVNDPETITLDANQAVNSVTFNNTGTTALAGGGTARTLSLGTGGITVASGAGAVTLGSGAAGNNVFLNLSGAQTWTNNSANDFTINNTAATFTRATGATLLLNQASTGNFAVSTTVAPLVNTIIGPWAFYGTGADQKYAVSGATVTGLTGTIVSNVNSMGDATANYEYTAAATTTAGLTTLTANTISTSQANTISLSNSSGAAYNLIVNGILATAATGTFTISKSTSSDPTRGLQIGSSGELVIAGRQAVTISAPIHEAGGAGRRVVYSGSSTLTLSGVNTYTGSTTVSSGTLRLSNSLALQNSPLNTSGSIAGDSTNGLKTTLTELTLGGLTGNKNLESLFTTTAGGYETLTGLTLNPVSGTSHSYSGVIANGAANMTLTKSGAGTQILSGGNTYTGPTQIDGGILVFGNTAAYGSTSGVTASATGTIGLGVGAAGYYSATDLLDLFNTNTLAGFSLDPASGVAVDTTNGNLTITPDLTGSRSLTKVGSGTLTLDGAKTLTGAVTVAGGILAFNNIAPLDNVSGIAMSGGAALRPDVPDAVITKPITVGDIGTDVTFTGPTINSGSNLFTLGGEISGDGNVIFDSRGPTNAASTILLNGASTYAGSTRMSCSIGTNSRLYVRLGTENALPATTVLTMDGGNGTGTAPGRECEFDLNGNDQTLAGLTSVVRTLRTHRVVNNSATPATLTINNSANYTFPEALGDAAGSNFGLTKSGAGTFTLSGSSTYTGATSISDGALGISNLSALGNTSGITITDGGTLLPNLDALAIGVPITLGSTGTNATINAPTSGGSGVVQTLTLNSAISGAGDLTFNGSNGSNSYGTIVLNAANNYLGATRIDCSNGGATCWVNNGVTNALPVTTVLTLDGGPGAGTGRTLRYDLKGFDQTLAGLTNATGFVARRQEVHNTGAAATLTVNNADDYTFGVSPGTNSYARIQGAISLVKSGAGTFTLTNSHTYTDATAVNEGTLGLNGASLTSVVTVAGGAAMEFTLGAPASTTGSLDLGTGTVKIVGTVDNASDYQLMTASGGITGSLTLDIGITGYQLELRNSDTELWLAYVGTGGYSAWALLNGAGPNLDDDHDGDGVSNGVEYFIGGPNGNTTGFTALPGVTAAAGTLSVTFTKAADYVGVYGTDYEVQVSSALASWSPAPGGTVTFPSATEVKYTFPAGTKNFARLQVTGP